MRSIKFFIVFLTLSISISSAAAAKLSDSDQHLLALSSDIAAQPQLMDAGYLSYTFGTPAVRLRPTAGFSQTWEWHEPANENLLYKLDDQTNAANEQRRLTFFAPADSKIDLKELESAIGTTPQQYFDQQLNRVEAFTLAPTTKLIAVQSPNTFKISQFAIEYTGSPLPPPSQQALSTASGARRAQAFAHHEKGRHDQALPLLSAHIREQPADIEAHIKLAESYKARFHLNEAIEQYRIALQLSGDNWSLRNRCLDGLKSLKVLPDQSETIATAPNHHTSSHPPSSLATQASPLAGGF